MFGFGKKVEIEVPDGRGGTKKVKVLQKQFDQWIAEGKIKRIEGFTAHISDPLHGAYTETWNVGEAIPQETYDRFKDKNGEVYALVVYEAGEPKTNLIKKDMWDQLQGQLDQIERASRTATDDFLRELNKK